MPSITALDKFMMDNRKVTIIGAGASGLFCAGLLGQKGYHVIVIDCGKKPGRKILISGGGKCNFTNLSIEPDNYLSNNPHFCKSALKRFSQWDFIELVTQYGIGYHKKGQGQLFCDNSAKNIVDMLISECQKGYVTFKMQTVVEEVRQIDKEQFLLQTSQGEILSNKVIVATGGLSMPALGTTPIGYKIAESFNLPVVPVRAGLVPFTLPKSLLDIFSSLSGISIPIEVSNHAMTVKDDLLFTHRGLSGPAILQISNYWQPKQAITINLLPNINLIEFILSQQLAHPEQTLKNSLTKLLPKRLIDCLIQLKMIPDTLLKQLNSKQIQQLTDHLTAWQILPNSTEGYRTAEVTLGGVSTEALSSKTMEVKTVPNLYFIGEVIDVTGQLGGYNFQWAWSSAFACAEHL